MYCNSCGANNSDESRFCSKCGTALVSLNSDVAPFGAEYTKEKQDPFGAEYTKEKQDPFGVEYTKENKINSVGLSSNVPLKVVNPYAYTQDHSQRAGWSTFVFVTALIMSIAGFVSFIGYVPKAFLLFSDIQIPQGVIYKELPDVFETYRAMFIPMIALVLAFFVCCLLAVIYERGLQKKSIAMEDVNVRIKLAKIVLFLLTASLVALIGMSVFHFAIAGLEFDLTENLTQNGWTKNEILEVLGIAMLDRVEGVNINYSSLMNFVIVAQFLFYFAWQIVLIVIGIVKSVKIYKFLIDQRQ